MSDKPNPTGVPYPPTATCNQCGGEFVPDDTGIVPMLRCATCDRLIPAGAMRVPYPTFCLHPDKCRGLSCCPRKLACSE